MMTAVLEVDTVSKTFTRTQALAGVSMTIGPGEVHALLGQNGSGKSTLIKILSGYHQPDPGGAIRIQGNELPFQAPMQSYRLGCRFVQQDLGLVPTLSVQDNMSLGSGFPTAWGTIRDRASREQAAADLAKLNLDIDP
jgi:ribose transport system ATP-binding protein